jgi:hypothetical protein
MGVGTQANNFGKIAMRGADRAPRPTGLLENIRRRVGGIVGRIEVASRSPICLLAAARCGDTRQGARMNIRADIHRGVPGSIFRPAWGEAHLVPIPRLVLGCKAPCDRDSRKKKSHMTKSRKLLGSATSVECMVAPAREIGTVALRPCCGSFLVFIPCHRL